MLVRSLTDTSCTCEQINKCYRLFAFYKFFLLCHIFLFPSVKLRKRIEKQRMNSKGNPFFLLIMKPQRQFKYILMILRC